MSSRFVLAITGASGSVFARRLLQRLVGSEAVAEVHLVASGAAVRVAHEELDTQARTPSDLAAEWLDGSPRHAELVVHPLGDIGAAPASGSFRHDGMVVCPCSTATLAAIAHGTTTHLVHRAAECVLKERRRLVLMPRETPLSLVHLENMVTVTRAGAVVMPLAPPWYHRPRTLDDLVDHAVDRVLDHLGLAGEVTRRWSGQAPDRAT